MTVSHCLFSGSFLFVFRKRHLRPLSVGVAVCTCLGAELGTEQVGNRSQLSRLGEEYGSRSFPRTPLVASASRKKGLEISRNSSSSRA